MRRLALALVALVWVALPAHADVRVWSWCEIGGNKVNVGGLNSTTKWQQSFPACTITVYDAGTLNLATIFSDNNSTPQANPFTADATTGYWKFYGTTGSCYDVRMSGAGIVTPQTLGDICIPLTGSGGGVIIGDSPSGQSFIILIGGDGANNTVPPFVCGIPSPSDSSTATCIFPCSNGSWGISSTGKPTSDCTPNQIIQTGNEVGPCGSDQMVQFNNAGDFGCDFAFLWDQTTNTLTLGDSTDKGSVGFVQGNFSANLSATTLTADRTLLLPDTDGTLCTTITCPGGGTGTPGGDDKDVQFNDSGAFGGENALEWDKVLNRLTVTGDVLISGSGSDLLFDTSANHNITFSTTVASSPPTLNIVGVQTTTLGSGGPIAITGGASTATTLASPGGGGGVLITGGAASTSASPSTNVGGSVIAQGGLGGDTFAGGPVELLGGTGGATNGPGGEIDIQGGTGGGANGDGGNVILRGGTKQGAGTYGVLEFHDSADDSKIAVMDMQLITTGNTHVFQWPDIDGTVCVVGTLCDGTGGGGYDTIADEGTPLTQRTTLNFIGSMVNCVDNGGATRTDCTFTDPQAYTTVQDEGSSLTQRSTLNMVGSIVSCADSGGKTVCTFTATSVPTVRVTTGSCATTGCQVTGSWSTAFADTNYTAVCSVEDSTAQNELTGLRVAKISSRSTTQIVVDIDNYSGSGVTGTLHCTGVHD